MRRQKMDAPRLRFESSLLLLSQLSHLLLRGLRTGLSGVQLLNTEIQRDKA